MQGRKRTVGRSCSPSQILWTFSIYLESLAIMPQLYMITKTGEAETITSHYLFAMGLYRALYIVNWVFRFYMEGYYDWIAIVAGCVQTLLYCDFFYLYITKGWSCVYRDTTFWYLTCLCLFFSYEGQTDDSPCLDISQCRWFILAVLCGY